MTIVLTGSGSPTASRRWLSPLLMLRSGRRLLRDSSRILLEGTPKDIDVKAVGRVLAGQSGVVEVHDLHVWEVTSGFPALSAHVLVPPGEDCHARRRELEQVLHERFEIDHTTLQVDHQADDGLLAIGDLTARD